jgi:hypothetical protein
MISHTLRKDRGGLSPGPGIMAGGINRPGEYPESTPDS